MIGTRRTLLLLIATVAVLLGATVPAQASFSGKSPALAATVGTIQVAAPTNLSAGVTRCSTTTYTWNINGVTTTRTTTTMQARVSWKASSTPRVASYLVTAHTAGGTVEVGEVSASTTIVTVSVDAPYSTQGIRFSVTAKTDYGWTAESQQTGVIKC